jgi:hypothetical protein
MNEENTADIDVSAKKLTDWKNPPEVRDLKQDLTDAYTTHSTQTSKIQTWLDNMNVEGAAKIKAEKGRSQVQPKLIRKQAEWRYAALSEPFLDTDEVFKVKPVSWDDREAAQQNQIVLNNQFNTKIDKVLFIDSFVRAAVDEGTVIVRVGWDYQEEAIKEQAPIIELTVNPEMAQIHEELAQMKVEDPNAYEREVPDELKEAHESSVAEGVPYEGIITGYEEVDGVKVLKNEPTLDVCHYENVVIDPTCMGVIEDAQFVMYQFESSLSELKRDAKYKNLDHINLQTSNILGEPDSGPDNGGSFNFSDKPRQKFTVHEYWGYWDIDGSGLVKPIVASWVGDVMIRLEENPFPDKRPPFVAVPYLPVRRSVYGEPDGELLIDNQRIIGAVTRGMIDIMGNSANSQTGSRKDALDTTNRRRFREGKDYEFNGNVDPRQAFYMHTYPEIPTSAQYMVQSQSMEAESMTGVKAFSGGLSGNELGDTATGVRGVLDAASKRELNILRRLSQGLIKIGRKMIAMNSEFLSEKEIVRLTNDEFVEIRRDDLPGNFDLRLTIATAEADNAKAQELSFVLQTIGPDEDPIMRRMILADIMRLRKMPDMAKKIEDYKPEPDPMQQKLQELEVAKLEAEIAEIQSKTQENMATAQEKGAKAGNLASDTDKKNLDFVEQESGVKQERDLQKSGEQARSQAEVKKLEYKLKADAERQSNLRKYLEKDAG